MTDEISVGDHLVAQRLIMGAPAYTHHGIYVGEGQVIHYAGNSQDPAADGKKIQLVSVERFHAGHGYWKVPHPNAAFKTDEVVARALSRLGEDGYSVFANNCEHFCNWAIDGHHASQQVDAAVLRAVTEGSQLAGAVGTLAIPGVAGAATGYAGGAAMMKGLATIGAFTGGAVSGLAVAGGTVGAITATMMNKTVLADQEGHSDEEAEARRIGRAASITAAVGTAAGTIPVVSLAGVPGLSAAGITSGLATIGGGSMAAGIAAGVVAPAAAAVGIGYGAYKLAQHSDEVREGLTKAGNAAGDLAEKGKEAASKAVETIAPIAKDAAEAAGELAKRGLRSLLSSVETGAASLKRRLDRDEPASD